MPVNSPRSFPVCTNKSAMSSACQPSVQRKPGSPSRTHPRAKRRGSGLQARFHGPNQPCLPVHSPVPPPSPNLPCGAGGHHAPASHRASSAHLASPCNDAPCKGATGSTGSSMSLRVEVVPSGKKKGAGSTLGGGEGCQARKEVGQITSQAVSGSDIMDADYQASEDPGLRGWGPL